MPLKIAVCNTKKEYGTLCDMLAASPSLKSVDYEPALLESGGALLDAVRAEPGCYDILLLSATVGGKASLETARRIRELDEDCPIILTAPNGELAADGYAVFATGFLVRPYSQAQLDLFLHRAVSHCGRRQSRALFYIKVRQDFVSLSENDLVFAESNLKYLLLHMVDGSVIRTMMTLDALKALLKGPQFMITHKSFLINMDYVTDVQPCEFALGSYGTAAITQRRYPQIRNQYFAYMDSRAPGEAKAN